MKFQYFIYYIEMNGTLNRFPSYYSSAKNGRDPVELTNKSLYNLLFIVYLFVSPLAATQLSATLVKKV